MKNDQALTTLKDQSRFYLTTPEKAAEALLFVRELERFAEEIKEKVKERTIKIMDEKQVELITYSTLDESTGEVREWEVRRSYGTTTKEYRPDRVIAAIGVEAALPFIKVSKTALETFLKRKTALGEITMETLEQALADPVEKVKKGAGVILREVKPTK